MNETQIAPWERQKGESHKAFAAFVVYRDLGAARCYTKVAQQLNVSRPLIARWGSRWHWQVRIDAWEREQDRKRQQEADDARRQMVERHATIAMAFQNKVVERLQHLKPEELTPTNIERWMDVAVKIERLSRGVPTEITEVAEPGAGELDELVLDDPEAKRLACELTARILRKSGGSGQGDADGVGMGPQPGAVEAGPSPGAAQ